MTTTGDPYRFFMDDSISETSQRRSSSRTRKPTTNNIEKPTNKKVQNKRIEKSNQQQEQQRIVTRSSQKSPLISMDNQNENSFMSDIGSGFSQFINPKKRQREEKKTKTFKRPKIPAYSDENQPPNEDIQAIEQIKLIYETAGGKTNLARAAATNAQILANRATTTNTNTTYNVNVIEDTQTDDNTSIIPDTIANNDTQHNDSSWQRDIDRLMRKLEEPLSSMKTETQIEETQIEEENIGSMYISQTERTYQQPIQTATAMPQSNRNTTPPLLPTPSATTTTIIPKEDISVQTENSSPSSSIHDCCQDVSTCPCVLRYSKLERLFMEKMSRFISIVPTVPPDTPLNNNENHQKRRIKQNYPRFRRFRGHRRINHHYTTKPSIQNNDQSTTIEEISDETTTTELDPQLEETVEAVAEQNTTTVSNIGVNPQDNINSKTITIEKVPENINDLSSIEKVDTTTLIDHPSTLCISSTTNTCSTARRLVLTTSSLDENQKSQFRLFLNRFNISTSSAVDSSTTHIIVNENSPLVCPLTGKIIQGIARHLFIVSHRWLDECLNEENLVDERPYEVRGDTSLGSDHGGMRRSRLTPSYLLENYSICLRCSSSDCAPLQTIEQVQELIELCGAKLVKNFSEIKTLDQQRQMILILGVNGFQGNQKKRQALLDTCQQFNVKCLNIHWLLISIAKYEIQPFDTYDINQI